MTTEPAIMLDDERLIRDGEAAVALYGKSREQARRQIIPMARGLCAAKRKYPATQVFGDWLETSSYREIEHQDRAALIKIGEEDVFAEKFVRTTSLVSPRTIWDAICELKSSYHDGNSPTLPNVTAETRPNDAYKPPEPVPAAPQVGKNPPLPAYGLRDGYTGKPAKEGAAVRLDMVKELKLSPDDAVELLGAYPQMRQKLLKRDFTTAGRNKRIKRDGLLRLFQRGLEVVRAGKAPKLSNSAGNDHVDLRTFFPDLPEAFCRSMKFDAIIAQFDRLLMVNDEAARLLATRPLTEVFDELHHLLETGNPMPPRKPRAVAIQETDSKAHIKHEVRYCGEVIWPQEWLKDASYKDLNAGWHLVDFWVHHLENATPQKPKEIAVKVRGLIRDLEAADSIHGIVRVMDAVMSAYSRKNEGHDKADFAGCVAPGSPR